MAEADRFYAAAERRIEYIAIGLGAAGAMIAGIIWGVPPGIGFGAGAAFSWVNFRWMKQGVGTQPACKSAGRRRKSVRRTGCVLKIYRSLRFIVRRSVCYS